MRPRIPVFPYRSLLAVIILTVSCCSLEYYSEGDYFFIRRQGAVMPVWVRGRADSGVMIVYLHGGPGDTAQYAHRFSFFRELETRYRVAYWDQRCSGMSQGDPDSASFTVDAFTADLDLLVDTLKELYNPESIFLYGISWGGTLGVAYLGDPGHQAKVRGFIEEGGGHNMPLLLERSIAIILDYAHSRVEEGAEDAGLWNEATAFFTAHPDPSDWGIEDYRQYATYLGKTHPFSYVPERSPDEITGPDLEMIFFSPMSLAYFFNQGALVPRFNILDLDLSPGMGAITLPVFLAWGEYDINSPPDLAFNARDSLGTPTEDIVLRIFPDSGHNPCVDRPAEYLPAFVDFIEAYR